MTARTDKRGFAARPTGHDGLIKAGDASTPRASAAIARTAWLTIDVTPAMRGRLKIAVFNNGITAADMLCELLACEFPDTSGDRS